MGRWRPPPPKTSPYITPAGYEALQAELKDLWVRRRDVVAALAAAAAEGDRSENAEYIYRKKELGGIDRRIRYLQKRLPDLVVVDRTPAVNRAYFGAWVEVETPEGELAEYRIVGPDEADPAQKAISIDSPLARAILKKAVDDTVELVIDEQRRQYIVTGIRYR